MRLASPSGVITNIDEARKKRSGQQLVAAAQVTAD